MLNTEQPKSTVVPVLDSLRAFAALSVCLFHFVCTVIGFTSNKILLSIFDYGHYGVQMFFVISGFVIPWAMYHARYKIKNFFTFTAKRLIRLEPPYIFSLIIAIIIAYARTLSPHYNGVDIIPSVKQVLLHFGYMIPFFEGQTWIRNVYWTLAVEFQYYFAIGLLFPLIANKKMVFRMMLYALFVAGPLVAGVAFLPHYLPVFLLGILLFLYKTTIIKEAEFYIISFVSCASIFMFLDIATLCFSLATYIIILFFDQFKSRVGEFLGKISYSLYLFHGLIGMTVLNYIVHTTHSSFVKFLFFVFSLAITIVFSYLVYRFIEKPSKEWSSRIKYKKPENE